MEKHKAASEFNAYVKSSHQRLQDCIELGLNEKSVHDKYIGSIFTKQQTGFDVESQKNLQKKALANQFEITDDPNQTLLCGYNDFDPFIKFGRDNQLFVKREYLDNYAEIGKGLNFTRFKKFMAAIFNIENHPFSEDFFLFFDTAKDGLVDFYEMVVAMDIIEKGTFDEKCKFCFAMYDIMENGVLDIYTLREVLKKAFVNQIVNMEQAIQKLQYGQTQHKDGWLWIEFEKDILPLIEIALPLALDRMEFHKNLINELEFKFNFNLESVEHLWNMYKPTLDKGVSENRLRTAAAFSAHSPDLITKEQFKLILYDVFKVRDAQLVNNIFLIADTNGNGALDIRELIGNIIFWLRGTLGYKFALFFEVFSSVNAGIYVSKENIIKVVGDALKVFKETFFQAKNTADKMNKNLNGVISYDEFRDYCKLNPQSIDFLCRLTIGPYPLSEDLQQKLIEHQKAQMAQYYPQLMLMNGEGPMNNDTAQIQLEENKVNTRATPIKQMHGSPQKQQPLMLQYPQSNQSQILQNPNSFQIIPLEEKRKQSSQQSRLNFAGVGQQQIFNSIKSSSFPVVNANQPPQINPNKRWLPRD